MKHLLPIFLIGLCVACHPYNPPTPSPVIPVDTVMTRAKYKAYGTYYKRLDKNVFSLDLYSAGLQNDSLGYIVGSGTNLYLSDILLPDSVHSLQPGTYTLDTTAAAYTFLPGMNIDGGISGTYLLLINEDAVKQIYYFTSGTFTLAMRGDTADMTFHLLSDKKKIYNASFSGILTQEQ